jgi:hypothetical protein
MCKDLHGNRCINDFLSPRHLHMINREVTRMSAGTIFMALQARSPVPSFHS